MADDPSTQHFADLEHAAIRWRAAHPRTVIERDYVLAWFLTGLAGHPLRDVLAFKGGTALRRCWFADYRFSEDLDFTLTCGDRRSGVAVAYLEIMGFHRQPPPSAA